MQLIIRNLPDDIHKALKIRAAEKGISMQDLAAEAIREKLTHEDGK